MALLNKIKEYLPTISIVIISFFFFSNRFSAAVSSDDALSVLMLADFQLPEALYCWGQDRGGSIVPLIGQFFYKTVHLSPIWAEGIARYLILILGFICYSSFLKNKNAMLILAILYFLPPIYFIGFTKYSWGLLYSLMGVIFWLIDRYDSSKDKLQQFLYIALIQLFAILSTWVMDQGFIILSTVGFVILYKKLKSYQSNSDKRSLIDIAISLSILIVTAITISYFKSLANTTNGYLYGINFLNNPSEILEVIAKIYQTIVQGILSFQINNPLYSIYAYSMLLGSFALIYQLLKTRGNKSTKSVTFLLLLIAAAIFMTIILSKWVLVNYVSRRYFSGLYFILGILFIYRFQNSLKEKSFFGITVTFMLLGFLSTPYNYKYNAPKSLTPRYQQLSELREKESVGIIGDYWYAYGLSFVNPEEIVATPHQYSDYRNQAYTKAVFNKAHLYLVKNLWLDSFPNTTAQFGQSLQIKGKPFFINEVEMCEYEVISK